jgi:hypothetical protein
MADSQRVGLDEVLLHLAALEDPRSTVNRQHPLVSVVVIALLAVLACASGKLLALVHARPTRSRITCRTHRAYRFSPGTTI